MCSVESACPVFGIWRLKMEKKLALATAAALTLAAIPAYSATLYWDATPGTPDGASQGGGGTWDTTLANANWDDGSAYQQWNNGTSDTAVFGGTVGSVALGEAITVGGLTFGTASYAVTGNTLTLASGTIIHSTVGTNNSTDPVITSQLAGTNGFTKTGSGWLGLEATTSSLSGNVNIQQGTLYTRHEALGSSDIVFTGSSTLVKVYNANSNFTQDITINDGVTATMSAGSFYYNANHAGVLSGGTTTTLNLSVSGNTEIQFNNTANTFTGKLIIGTGGTADNGGRAVFKSLADSSQIIQINNGVLRLARIIHGSYCATGLRVV